MKKIALIALSTLLFNGITALDNSDQKPAEEKELSFWEKRLHNPKYIYRYTTSSGKKIAIDVRKVVQFLALSTSPFTSGKINEKGYLKDGCTLTLWDQYTIHTNIPLLLIWMSAGLWLLSQDLSGGLTDIFVLDIPAILVGQYIPMHIVGGSIYAARSLYTGNWLPWSIEE